MPLGRTDVYVNSTRYELLARDTRSLQRELQR
jgi:hypothetical protein